MRLLRKIADIFNAAAKLEHSREEVALLQERCANTEKLLQESDGRAKERSELLYDLQRVSSSEHFRLHEAMRNLNIERMRNAGAFADRDVILDRAHQLQKRIGDLKKRLSKYESVEGMLFDEGPVIVSDTHPDSIASEGATRVEPLRKES